MSLFYEKTALHTNDGVFFYLQKSTETLKTNIFTSFFELRGKRVHYLYLHRIQICLAHTRKTQSLAFISVRPVPYTAEEKTSVLL